MKTIGLIGGTGWVTTAAYYRQLNVGINEKRGGLNFPEIILFSLNNGAFKSLMDAGDWPQITKQFVSAATGLQDAGASCLALAAVTPHKIGEQIKKSLHIPFIDMGEAIAQNIKTNGWSKVGLLGTKITMEEDFLKQHLQDSGIEVLIPDQLDRDFIHEAIFSELARGIAKPETKERFLHCIGELKAKGIQAVILGCTEIPFLIPQQECPVPFIDPIELHVQALIDFALS